MSDQTEVLELAANILEKHDTEEFTVTSLAELTGLKQCVMPTASGLNDYDYQNLSDFSMGQQNLQQLRTLNKVSIPAEILEHFKHVKCHCMMGLFPEIGRAWLTIDSEIYIWTYESVRDVAYYDGLNHVIIGVGLVTPRQGVFINEVKYLLILTTPFNVVVLGVLFGDMVGNTSSVDKFQSTSKRTEMQLLSKPIFVLSADNISFNCVIGSDDGRIFLGGRDGCIYEIAYQAESTWLGKRCKKINHSQGVVSFILPNFLKVFSEVDPIFRMAIDNSRKLLYVLTEKSSIEVWNFGQDLNNIKRISKISQNYIFQSAAKIVKTVDHSVFTKIISICPLSSNDCDDIHLLAITQCGVRLFFTTSNIGGATSANSSKIQTPADVLTTPPTYEIGSEDSRKENLLLLHVRLPPGYTPNAATHKPKQVQSAYYEEGSTLLVSTPQPDQNVLWSITSAPFSRRSHLTESTTILPLDGVVWALCGTTNKSYQRLQSVLGAMQNPKKIILLTHHGVHIIALLKPIDILHQLLIVHQDPHHETIKTFFMSQGNREACINALILASSKNYRGSDVATWATQAFFLYGGEPLLYKKQEILNVNALNQAQTYSNVGACSNRAHKMFSSTAMVSPDIASTKIVGLNHNRVNCSSHISPITVQNAPSINRMNDMDTIMFSPKHDSIYILVNRCLRPFWRKCCLDANLNSNLTKGDCATILEDLHSLKNFFETHSLNDFSATHKAQIAEPILQNGFGVFGKCSNEHQNNCADNAVAEEKKSLSALVYLIKHSCEVIELWKILCEHQFNSLVSLLSREQQLYLKDCTFRELILSRADLCAHLVVSLINSYLKDNASVSTISAKFRKVCPSIYRHEDAVSFKATEILMNSKSCSDISEKEEKISIALQLCKDAAPKLPLANICQQFTFNGYYDAVIELITACAAKIDPEGFGINYYLNEEPEDDREGFSAYSARINCYKEVNYLLDHILESVCCNEPSQERPSDICFFNTKNSYAKIMSTVNKAMLVEDPLLHVTMFQWLLLHDKISELLSVRNSSLATFLRRSVAQNPQNLSLVELLWKYYEKNEHHAQAARILENLASTKSDVITLDQRIEYLARAVLCMRNGGVGYSLENGVLLKELEDKLEVGRVQKKILDAVACISTPNATTRNALQSLNMQLFDITYLYQEFAERFHLWECKLSILNCSQHNDPLLIESVWAEIINKAAKAAEQFTTSKDRASHMLSEMELLFKEFGSSGHCFPLSYIIQELEIKACQMRLPVGAVPEKLIAMNVNVELLMEYYSRMISLSERVWANEGNEWHLMDSAIHLIYLIYGNINLVSPRAKRRVFGKAQDIISICLNICYQKPGTGRMQDALKDLQCRIRRELT